MVLPIPIKQPPISSVPVVLTGGQNEEVTTLELKEGELLDCVNYIELDGPYHGYQSMPGYEVYDGTLSPSDVPLNMVATPAPRTVVDGIAREQRRSEINPVPGSGPVRGVSVYEAGVYAVRDSADTLSKGIFHATPTGWSELTGATLSPGGACDWAISIFSKYPAADTVNSRCLFMADGVSKPISYDGTTPRQIDDAGLPDTVFATHVAAFDNRLWLACPGGNLFFSELGDPGSWDGQAGAGQIPTGDEITDLIVAPGNVLIVFMRNSIKVVYIAERPTGDFSYQLKEFSPRSGCLPNGSDRMLGEIYYIDDRGPTTLTTTDQFGDFGASSVTKKIQRTFLANKKNFSATVVHREMNQWRIFFNDGSGLCFTFLNKRVKGVTRFKYKDPVLCTAEGEDVDGKIQMFFGSQDGFVYQMDKGTSFNGENIDAYFVTSYYHYRSPQRNKRFIRLTFEISADLGTKLFIKTDYDYKSRKSPKNTEVSPEILGRSGIWGEATWSEFIWGAAYVDNPAIYIEGYGVNMSVTVRSSDKYHSPHIVHNFITDLHTLSTKM